MLPKKWLCTSVLSVRIAISQSLALMHWLDVLSHFRNIHCDDAVNLLMVALNAIIFVAMYTVFMRADFQN